MKMNTPNPLVPQGALPDKGKAQFRITVLATLAVHVVLLCVLLIAGCNKKTPEQPVDTGYIPPPPVIDAWPTSSLPPPPPPPPIATPVAPTGGVGTLTPPPVVDLTAPQHPPPIDHGTEPVPAAGGVIEHTIVAGDNFAKLGKKYGVGYKTIEAANPGVNPNRLKLGEKIKIPAAKPAAAGTPSATAPEVSEDGMKIYKVASGDNLGKIARVHGVSVSQIQRANNLRTTQIRVGQKLKIPAKAPAVSTPAPESTPIPPVPPPGQ